MASTSATQEPQAQPIIFDPQSCPTYTYDSLPTQTSIRLISELREERVDGNLVVDDSSGTQFPLLHFSLQTEDLADSPSYDCLSYTWGRPTRVTIDKEIYDKGEEYYSRKAAVLCNGRLLWIGRNLYCFLKRLIQMNRAPERLRKEHFVPLCGRDRAEALWVDSICINQEDLEERSRQVQIMDRIYSTANIVHAWLGEADAFSRSAVSSLIALVDLGEDAADRARGLNPIHGDFAALGVNEKINVYSIYAFMKRSWFRRAWIVQEAVLADRLVVWCGSVQFSFDTLALGARFLFRSKWWSSILTDVRSRQKTGFGVAAVSLFSANFLSETAAMLGGVYGEQAAPYESAADVKNDFDPTYAINQVFHMRLAFGKETRLVSRVPGEVYARPGNQDLLTSFRLLEASEPKDKIYAFLGLRPSISIADALLPDYREVKTCRAVYTEATTYILKTVEELSLLAHKEDASRGRHSSLPSWVPDFSKPTLNTIQGEAVKPWSASGSVPLYLAFGGAHGEILSVHGLHVDHVSKIAAWSENDLSCVEGLLLDLPRLYSVDTPSSSSQESSNLSIIHQPTRKAAQSETTSHVTTPPGSSDNHPATPVQHRIEVLWRTLLANCCHQHHPASPSYGHAFTHSLTNHIAIFYTAALSQTLQSKPSARDDGKLQAFQSACASLRMFAQDERQSDAGGRAPFFLPEVDEFLEDLENDDYEIERSEDLSEFESRKAQMLDHRVLFTTTRNRYLGLGPKSLRPGDQVWLLAGASVPYVLRPRENGRFELVGECYVHGIMHGEAARGRDDHFVCVELE